MVVGWVCYGLGVFVLEKSGLGLLWVGCFCFGEDTRTKRERKKERNREELMRLRIINNYKIIKE